jgi:broad specificity phosphatase PhoE
MIQTDSQQCHACFPLSLHNHALFHNGHNTPHSRRHVLATLMTARATSSSTSQSDPITTTANSCETGDAQRPRRFLLLRHGQTDFNADGRIQGSSDFSRLSELGKTQARQVGDFLTAFQFGSVYVSPLMRAQQTLEVACEVVASAGLDLPTPTVIDDLREIDLYEWQGLLKQEIKDRFPDEYKKWRGDFPSKFVLPSGNAPVLQLWERARGVWEHLMKASAKKEKFADEPVLLVAHNAIIQALLCTSMGMGEDFFRKLEVGLPC